MYINPTCICLVCGMCLSMMKPTPYLSLDLAVNEKAWETNNFAVFLSNRLENKATSVVLITSSFILWNGCPSSKSLGLAKKKYLNRWSFLYIVTVPTFMYLSADSMCLETMMLPPLFCITASDKGAGQFGSSRWAVHTNLCVLRGLKITLHCVCQLGFMVAAINRHPNLHPVSKIFILEI